MLAGLRSFSFAQSQITLSQRFNINLAVSLWWNALQWIVINFRIKSRQNSPPNLSEQYVIWVLYDSETFFLVLFHFLEISIIFTIFQFLKGTIFFSSRCILYPFIVPSSLAIQFRFHVCVIFSFPKRFSSVTTFIICLSLQFFSNSLSVMFISDSARFRHNPWHILDAKLIWLLLNGGIKQLSLKNNFVYIF